MLQVLKNLMEPPVYLSHKDASVGSDRAEPTLHVVIDVMYNIHTSGNNLLLATLKQNLNCIIIVHVIKQPIINKVVCTLFVSRPRQRAKWEKPYRLHGSRVATIFAQCTISSDQHDDDVMMMNKAIQK